MGWNASDTRPLTFTDCARARGEPARPARATASSSSCTSSTSAASASRRWASASPRARSTRRSPTPRSARRSASRSPSSRRSRPSSPTWRPRSRRRRLLVYKAALLKDRGANFTLTAAQAKLKTGRLAVRCAEEAVQIHGGYGYIEEYPVCRFYRDAKILTIGEGTDEVQQMVIARALGRVSSVSRVLIANRGEIAVRIAAHRCARLGLASGRRLHATPTPDAPHVARPTSRCASGRRLRRVLPRRRARSSTAARARGRRARCTRATASCPRAPAFARAVRRRRAGRGSARRRRRSS